MSKQQIFKVQRSLTPPDAECLIYNIDKSYVATMPFEDMAELFEDPSVLKVYVFGEVKDGKALLDMSSRADAQTW